MPQLLVNQGAQVPTDFQFRFAIRRNVMTLNRSRRTVATFGRFNPTLVNFQYGQRI